MRKVCLFLVISYNKNGDKMKQYVTYVASPLGKLTILSDGESIIGLWIEKQKYYGSLLDHPVERKIPVLLEAEKWLNDYFAGKKPQLTFSVRFNVTPFRQMVYEQLLKIPYGKVMSYDQLAAIIALKTGKKKCAQAIGQAVGHNPISIIVPCHRLVGKDGSLKGYAGGLENKKKLLELEGANLTTLYGSSNQSHV